MTDVFSTEKRSQVMRAVSSKDTGPEWAVRRLAHSLGYRYRLHVEDLPGKPDLVFPSRDKVIFVHGCFWHQHRCKRGNRIPKTRTDYWVAKLQRNKQRDR
ncbi:MAG: DNA mismatch endonuclease Vsr, partial [Pirellulaceae bacterium]|nr:DNA mismatch endonuclease Vsr [Pirellulaceae bacterium]